MVHGFVSQRPVRACLFARVSVSTCVCVWSPIVASCAYCHFVGLPIRSVHFYALQCKLRAPVEQHASRLSHTRTLYSPLRAERLLISYSEPIPVPGQERVISTGTTSSPPSASIAYKLWQALVSTFGRHALGWSLRGGRAGSGDCGMPWRLDWRR